MKVAYIFRTNMASTFQLATMVLPQLEKGIHNCMPRFQRIHRTTSSPCKGYFFSLSILS
jgi:hypothetical protein